MEDSNSKNNVAYVRGIAGAIAGGVLGFLAYMFAIRQGFYALAIPGALIGIGCGLASQIESRILAVACALGALPLTLFAEWRVFPFVADEGFGYFVTHLHQLKTMTWIMLVIGVASAYWFGIGRGRRPN